MSNIKITLAAARVNAGMTQTEVAEKMGITHHTLLNWEKGRVTPKKASLEMMASLYGIPLENIFLPSTSLK